MDTWPNTDSDSHPVRDHNFNPHLDEYDSWHPYHPPSGLYFLGAPSLLFDKPNNNESQQSNSPETHSNRIPIQLIQPENFPRHNDSSDTFGKPSTRKIIFPICIDPIGEIPAFVFHYHFKVPKRIYIRGDHPIKDTWFIDLSQQQQQQQPENCTSGVSTLLTLLFSLGRFMSTKLTWSDYQKLNEETKKTTSLAFKKRILDLGNVTDETYSEDWENFLLGKDNDNDNNPGSVSLLYCDLLWGMNRIWTYEEWDGYCVLGMTNES